MTEHDDERKVSQRYRELRREEPPAHLDEAIRAQARRLGATRPAPLVPPTGRRSWHYPVAAAAVLVLAVAVTWHVEREQPDSAEPLATGQPAPAAQPEAKEQAPADAEARSAGPKAESPPPLRREAPVRQRKDEPGFVPDEARRDRAGAEPAEAPAAAAPSAPSAPSAAEEAPRALAKERTAEAAGDMAPMMSRRSVPGEAPEAWLERIAKLRREGRHEEADKALAEFRNRYPDFRIAREMLEQVERR